MKEIFELYSHWRNVFLRGKIHFRGGKMTTIQVSNVEQILRDFIDDKPIDVQKVLDEVKNKN